MLACFVYHRIGNGKHTNSLESLKNHFIYIKERFPVLLPGEAIARKKLSILLTFDDATFDFYHFVYPILKELNLRVLLGVPACYILDETTLSSEKRLSVPYPLMMQDGIFENDAPFCTWKELQEMVASGHVQVASHSYAHCNLTFPFVNREREIIQSKEIIQEKLKQAVTSFIYPFGRSTGEVHRELMNHYAYAFRIGDGYNFSWDSKKRPLLRIRGDQLKFASEPFTMKARLQHIVKALV